MSKKKDANHIYFKTRFFLRDCSAEVMQIEVSGDSVDVTFSDGSSMFSLPICMDRPWTSSKPDHIIEIEKANSESIAIMQNIVSQLTEALRAMKRYNHDIKNDKITPAY